MNPFGGQPIQEGNKRLQEGLVKAKIALLALLAMVSVLGLSLLSGRLWGEKPEKIELPQLTIVSLDLPIDRFVADNDLPSEVVRQALQIEPGQLAVLTLAETGLTKQEITARVRTGLIQYQEHLSKNWQKIMVKFALWLTLLPLPLVLLVRRKTSPRVRLLTAAAGTILFGVILGADPSPMGTVKDAVYLLTAHQTVFMPRIVALVIFLLTVVLANKFICSWGCQFGLLQEFLFAWAGMRKTGGE